MPISAHAKTGLLLLMISFCLPAASRAGRLTMPLPGNVCPTSSFGSWREGHLHGGIDFSTGGRTGVPVLAVDSCWVWRIRLWNGGYGKALYAQLRDGNIAVYGHLSRYSPEIEDLVEREQDLRGAYEVEIYCEPYVFSFVPGDTIAFSGDTGSGPPHLHFELRSGRHDHNKINPVPGYVDLEEDISPEVESLIVSPLSFDCSLNGSHHPVMIGHDNASDTIRVSGKFGLSVYAVDGVRCGRTLTPIIYEAWIDSTPVWGLDLDRFPFSKSHLVGSIYQMIAGRKYVRLFDPYNLDFRGFTCLRDNESPLIPGLTQGYHQFSVRVVDAWGNSDSLNVPFYYGDMPGFVSCGLEQDTLGLKVQMIPRQEDCQVEVIYRTTEGSWQRAELSRRDGIYVGRVGEAGLVAEVLCRLTGGSGFTRTCILSPGSGDSIDAISIETVLHADYLEIYGRSAVPPSSLPLAHVYEGSDFETIALQPVGKNVFRATCFPTGSDGVMHVRVAFEFGSERVQQTEGFAIGRIEPGARFWLVGDRFKVMLAASPAYSSSSLVRLREDSGEDFEGFTQTLGRVVLEPEGVFFSEKVDVLVMAKEEGYTSRHGVFTHRSAGPAFLGRFDSTGVASVRLGRLESLLVLEDRAPPLIEWTGRLRARAADGKGLFSAKVSDDGSGVDSGSLKAYVDDDVGIISYDPDTGMVSGRSRKPLQYGKHRLRLVATDRTGNSATSETVTELTR